MTGFWKSSCYKQTSVKMETIGEPPIFLGPIFIHDNSDFHNFTHFRPPLGTPDIPTIILEEDHPRNIWEKFG
jgi:hypothetical protein